MTDTATLENLDPNTLTIATNIRDVAALDDQFVASVAEHGVLTPVTAVRRGDTVEVTDGQRRTLAARQVGLATLPVYVRDVTTANEERAVERVVEQIVLNDHRADLTDAQRARGINQLLLAGVPATKVAKKLSAAPQIIEAARTVQTSTSAQAALDNGQVNLLDALALVEFDDDAHAQQQIVDASGSDDFEHVVEQLRIARAERERYEQAAAPYAAKGYTVLSSHPGWHHATYINLGEVRTAADELVTDTLVAETDPSHWAVLLEDTITYTNTATGEPVDEYDIDWDTEGNPNATPDEGLLHADAVTQVIEWEPNYFVASPQAVTDLGLTLCSWAAARRSGTAAHHAGANTSDDDALAQQRAAEADRQRQERRRLLALNKLGAAAENVRRRWIRQTLLAQKNAPKGAAMFIAHMACTQHGLFDDWRAQRVAAELLGSEDNKREIAEYLTPSGGDSRATIVLLAMTLGALESRTAKDAWRSPGGLSAEYLTYLQSVGYVASDIERVIIRATTAEDVYEALTGATDAPDQ